MVDANHAYSVPVAKRMAKELEAFDVRWFEEPVVPEDIAGYREVSYLMLKFPNLILKFMIEKYFYVIYIAYYRKFILLYIKDSFFHNCTNIGRGMQFYPLWV